MKIKKTISFLIIAVLVIDAAIFLGIQLQSFASNTGDSGSQTAATKKIDSTIVVDGTVTAQDEATLHFQTGGKLVSVPLKEGDKVVQGQTIAQLDTYDLQRQLTAALNTYKATRDTFDQSQENQNQGLLQHTSSQTTSSSLGTANTATQGTFGGDTGYTYLNDLAKRIVDQNQSNLDTSVANVEIANYALQMATLTSPLTGIVTHEDVDIAGQNVTPTTAFTVADPSTKVFRANIPASDIDYISEGMNATIMLDGAQDKINGTIVKIYPSKTTLASGEQVYQVDIQSDEVTAKGKLDQQGSAIIMTNAENVTLIPTWTVLSGKYVWVVNGNKPMLRSITVGKIHGDQIEVTSGLAAGDRVITDPKLIPSRDYQFL